MQRIFNNRIYLLYLAWVIIVALVLLQMLSIRFYRPQDYNWGFFDFVYILGSELLLGLILIRIWILPGYDFLRKWTWKPLRVLGFVGHALLYALCYNLLISLAFEVAINGEQMNGFIRRFTNLLFTDLHNFIKQYLVFLAVLLGYDFFQQNTRSIIRQKDLERELEQIRLQSLKAQLQPHFLFNALNSIVALIDEHRQGAQRALIHLSELLRRSMDLDPQRRIPVEEELDLLRKYLAIEEARYEDQLIVEWKTAGNALENLTVPPLLLQPLAENAIKHGFKRHEGPLVIRIEIAPGARCIRIANNGQALQQKASGQGLAIVRKRLAIHYAERATLRLFESQGWIINEICWHENL